MKYGSQARGIDENSSSPLRLKRNQKDSIYYETVIPNDPESVVKPPLRPKAELRGIVGPAD
jgi:hypothetical protein